MPPGHWDAAIQPMQLATLFRYEMYGRACLYSDAYVTSAAYKAPRTRDNQWLAFQHHLHPCDTPLPMC